MKKNMKPKSDLLVLEFTTENGNLSVQVLDDDKNVVLEQAQVGNQTLQLPEDGRVTVINMYRRQELEYLICNAPLEYANLVLNGDPDTCLKNVTEYKSLGW